MNTDPMFVPGMLDDVIAMNTSVMVDVCSIYPNTVVSNGRGGNSQSYGAPVVGVPCRMDDEVNKLLPQRAKDDIDVQKIERTIYIPVGYAVDIGYKIETSAGQYDGSVVPYSVVNVSIETEQTDIAAHDGRVHTTYSLVEVIY